MVTCFAIGCNPLPALAKTSTCRFLLKSSPKDEIQDPCTTEVVFCQNLFLNDGCSLTQKCAEYDVIFS